MSTPFDRADLKGAVAGRGAAVNVLPVPVSSVEDCLLRLISESVSELRERAMLTRCIEAGNGVAQVPERVAHRGAPAFIADGEASHGIADVTEENGGMFVGGACERGGIFDGGTELNGGMFAGGAYENGGIFDGGAQENGGVFADGAEVNGGILDAGA